jgi:hypothetical protein
MSMGGKGDESNLSVESIRNIKYNDWTDEDFKDVLNKLHFFSKKNHISTSFSTNKSLIQEPLQTIVEESEKFVIVEDVKCLIVGRCDEKIKFKYENHIDHRVGDLLKTDAVKERKQNCIDPYGLVSKKQNDIYFESKLNIAIIISAWKAQNYIEQLLDSIENNSMHPSMVLIGIDACKETKEELKKILNSKIYSFEINIYFSEENVGTFNIRNNLNDLAFEKYKSDVIINMDSDDMLHCQYIRAFHDLILINKDCIIAPNKLFNFRHSNGKLKSIQNYQCEVNCFSKEIWKKIGYYLPYRISSDREWLARAIKLNVKVITNKSMLYYRRMHDNQLTHDGKSYNLNPQKIQSHKITYGNLILMPKCKKIKLLKINDQLFELNQNSNKNIVLCSYLNYKEDPQRKIVWNDDYQKLIPLIESVIKNNVEIYVFHNCFDNPPKINFCNWIKIETNNDYVPTVARWFIYKEFLDNLQNKPNAIFMVDSTDVIMLHDPFSNLKHGVLYIGDEKNTKVKNNWMRFKEKHFIPPNDYRKTIETHAKKNLINAGLVGGKYEIAMQFLIEHCKNHENHSKNVEISTCMPIFNYTVWKNFVTNHVAGFPVNTIFKKNESNSKAWWKHK